MFHNFYFLQSDNFDCWQPASRAFSCGTNALYPVMKDKAKRDRRGSADRVGCWNSKFYLIFCAISSEKNFPPTSMLFLLTYIELGTVEFSPPVEC